MTSRSLNPLIPLLTVSLVAMGLCTLRGVATGTSWLLFMNVNLVLGWIPLGISLYMQRLARGLKKPRPTPALVALFILWLLFYPNAPYLVTDMVHVGAHFDFVLYDAILLSLFALSGMLLGWESLRHVHRLIEERFGQLVGWSIVFIVSILTSVGMYLGRYLRLNSWDVVADPERVIRAISWQVGASARYGHFLGILFLFSLILLSGYVVYIRQGRVPSTLRQKKRML